MRLLVDLMPSFANECYFAEWKSYPPIVERNGFYYCNFSKKSCNLRNGVPMCNGLIEYHSNIVERKEE